MYATSTLIRTTRASAWAGFGLSAIVVLFLLFDSLGKLVQVPAAVEGTVQLGVPPGAIRPIGIVLLACTLLYTIPPTAIVGAVLLTGYLGGAVATHVRVGSPILTHVLFPVYVSLIVWAGLYLRDERLRRLANPPPCDQLLPASRLAHPTSPR